MGKGAVIGIVVVIVVLAGGGALLAKHNSDSSKNTSSSSKSTTSSTDEMNMSSSSSSSSSTAAATNTVKIENFAFSPANITVTHGTTVTWTNMDSAAHTVTETDGQTGPKSESLAQGKSYSFTFDKAGTYKYDCSIHPSMTGTVTVTE